MARKRRTLQALFLCKQQAVCGGACWAGFDLAGLHSSRFPTPTRAATPALRQVPWRLLESKGGTMSELTRSSNSITTEARENRTIYRALRILESRAKEPGETLTDSTFVREWFRLRLGGQPHESFAVAWLDNKHRLIAFEVLFHGTIDGAQVYCREVVRSAIKHNAAAAIFSHNHPSGSLEPSFADRAITEQLRDVLKMIDVRVLDHIIVHAYGTLSLVENEFRMASAPIKQRKRVPSAKAKVKIEKASVTPPVTARPRMALPALPKLFATGMAAS
jgi:DNA repair protein RadC